MSEMTCLSPASNGYSTCRGKTMEDTKEAHLPHSTPHASATTMHHATTVKAVPARTSAVPWA